MTREIPPRDELPPVPLTEIAERGGLDPDAIVPFGRWAARVPWKPQARAAGRPRPRLILVTAVTPTAAGVGKTVTTIGLTDGLAKIGQRVIANLRQPALGPTLGMKGGGAGGGACRVIPTDRVNLGLLGDFDAISHAQNLLVAAGDNSRFHGDPHGFGTEPLLVRRAWHVNDRALRRITTRPDGVGDIVVETGIDLVPACESMAILALAKDPADLRARIGRMTVAFDKNGQPVTADDLEVGGAMTALMRDTVEPVLLSTLEGNPVLIQAGPFANLGPGVSGVMADRVALPAADFVITEAGFGSDLGGEKFMNLKTAAGTPWPDAAVLVTTIKSMLQHQQEGQSDPLAEGFENLSGHVDNLRNFNLPVIVAVNRHPEDEPEHVRRLLAEAVKRGAVAAVECFHFAQGGAGAVELAQAVVDATKSDEAPEPRGIYSDDAPVKEKVEAIAKTVYGAASVDWSAEALQGLETAERLGLGRARPCMVKTQYSFSAKVKLKGRPTGHVLPIREVRSWTGANLVVPLVGAVLTLPGLPERPGAADYDIDTESLAIIHRS